MLAVRYKRVGEDEVFKDLSINQYEQITDNDIFEILGFRGTCMELRKKINVFQSEEEFVGSMANPLSDNEAEIYLQDEFDEQDNCDSDNSYVVLCAEDVSKLLCVSKKDAATALFDVAIRMEEIVGFLMRTKHVFSCSSLLFMICTRLYLRSSYNREEDIYSVGMVMSGLVNAYRDNSGRYLVDEPDGWKKTINEWIGADD